MLIVEEREQGLGTRDQDQPLRNGLVLGDACYRWGVPIAKAGDPAWNGDPADER
jgi:hypothetical protein